MMRFSRYARNMYHSLCIEKRDDGAGGVEGEFEEEEAIEIGVHVEQRQTLDHLARVPEP